MKILVKSHGKAYKITKSWDDEMSVELLGACKSTVESARLIMRGIYNRDININISNAIDTDPTGFPRALCYGGIFRKLVHAVRRDNPNAAESMLAIYAAFWTSAGCNFDFNNRAIFSVVTSLQNFEENCSIMAFDSELSKHSEPLMSGCKAPVWSKDGVKSSNAVQKSVARVLNSPIYPYKVEDFQNSDKTSETGPLPSGDETTQNGGVYAYKMRQYLANEFNYSKSNKEENGNDITENSEDPHNGSASQEND
jgi:hypothetical protein